MAGSNWSAKQIQDFLEMKHSGAAQGAKTPTLTKLLADSH
jgi:hypothetical protein